MRGRKLLTLEVWESDNGAVDIQAYGNAIGYHPRGPGSGSPAMFCARKTIGRRDRTSLFEAIGDALGRRLRG